MPIVRVLQAHEWRVYRELRLTALQDSPDAFGSTHAREAAFPEQEWISRLAQGAESAFDRPLIAEDAGRAVGLAWARIDHHDPSTAMLYQVWVAPEARCRGIGRELLGAAIAWSRETGATVLRLSVTSGAHSAMALYREAGFVTDGVPSPLRPTSALLQQPLRLAL